MLSSYKFAMRVFSIGIDDEFPLQVGSVGFATQSALTISDPTHSCDSVRHHWWVSELCKALRQMSNSQASFNCVCEGFTYSEARQATLSPSMKRSAMEYAGTSLPYAVRY